MLSIKTSMSSYQALILQLCPWVWTTMVIILFWIDIGIEIEIEIGIKFNELNWFRINNWNDQCSHLWTSSNYRWVWVSMQPIHQSINQSINQSIQSINQSIHSLLLFLCRRERAQSLQVPKEVSFSLDALTNEYQFDDFGTLEQACTPSPLIRQSPFFIR